MGPTLAKLRSESRERWRMHEGANARYPEDLLSIMAFFFLLPGIPWVLIVDVNGYENYLRHFLYISWFNPHNGTMG